MQRYEKSIPLLFYPDVNVENITALRYKNWICNDTTTFIYWFNWVINSSGRENKTYHILI